VFPDVAESAVMLDRVLRFCYPGAEPAVDSIDQLREILEISLIKYDIQCISTTATKYLEGYIETHPVAVFAIACRHEWRDLAKDAARASLKLPLRSFTEPAPELTYIDASHYHSLLRYHAACGVACATVTKNLRWIPPLPTRVWVACSDCPRVNRKWYLSDGASYYIREWFLTYMKASRKVLKVTPSARVDDPSLMCEAVKGLANCTTCRKDGFAQLQSFATNFFVPKIISAIDEV
ncbi:hypothetical protein DFH06DRAFT_1368929, partial [Mycena polygramma]